MKYVEIQKYFEKLKVFSIADVKILDEKFSKVKIMNWCKKWYIIHIRQWYYLYSQAKLNQNLLFLISNTVYAPSYISLETALNYYWIIPEHPFVVTAVSTIKTYDIHSKVENFFNKPRRNSKSILF